MGHGRLETISIEAIEGGDMRAKNSPGFCGTDRELNPSSICLVVIFVFINNLKI